MSPEIPGFNRPTSWTGDVVYQIYPRSFCERRANPGDLRGEGSLCGITEKLDYLQDLGINAIWISPFYPSPMKDGGYDVANYTDVDPRFGDLVDFKELVTEAHLRNIKVMIDLIPNHSSVEHPWFSDESKKDYYLWKDPAPDGGPPNKWASVFSLSRLHARQRGELVVPEGELTPPYSAWEFDAARGQYYNHTFAIEQADLNWANPRVREEFKAIMRFWFDLGTDGFRVDAVNHTGKDLSLTDEEANPDYREGIDNPYDQLKRYRSANYPGTLYGYLEEMAAVLEEPQYRDRDLRLIFEAYADDDTVQRIDRVSPRASSFNFARINAPWSARVHKRLLDGYHANLPPDALPNQVNGNHDKPRLATRIGELAARAAALVNLTSQGTPFIYNGEEGGFTDVFVPPELQDDRLGMRDPARTPMLWSNEKNAGFSEADSLWLPIDSDYRTKNLELQRHDPHSSFNFYKTLLRLRNGSPTLREGRYYPLDTDDVDVLAFARRYGNNQTVTLANFSNRPANVRIFGTEQEVGRAIITSARHRVGGLALLGEGINLAANEAVVIVRSA